MTQIEKNLKEVVKYVYNEEQQNMIILQTLLLSTINKDLCLIIKNNLIIKGFGNKDCPAVMNAIIESCKNKVSLNNSKIYFFEIPNLQSINIIINTNVIKEIYFFKCENYSIEQKTEIIELLAKHNIKIEQIQFDENQMED
jgi:hypothetical protein